MLRQTAGNRAPPLPFPSFCPLTATFPKLAVILRQLYIRWVAERSLLRSGPVTVSLTMLRQHDVGQPTTSQLARLQFSELAPLLFQSSSFYWPHFLHYTAHYWVVWVNKKQSSRLYFACHDTIETLLVMHQVYAYIYRSVIPLYVLFMEPVVSPYSKQHLIILKLAEIPGVARDSR
jgi:hypothetical protein